MEQALVAAAVPGWVLKLAMRRGVLQSNPRKRANKKFESNVDKRGLVKSISRVGKGTLVYSSVSFQRSGCILMLARRVCRQKLERRSHQLGPSYWAFLCLL